MSIKDSVHGIEDNSVDNLLSRLSVNNNNNNSNNNKRIQLNWIEAIAVFMRFALKYVNKCRNMYSYVCMNVSSFVKIIL